MKERDAFKLNVFPSTTKIIRKTLEQMEDGKMKRWNRGKKISK